MTALPIEELRGPLIKACRAHRRIVVQAPTGSGKSTRIPQFLIDEGMIPRGRVVVLQPRRIAARLLAARVATERGTRLGDEVGYQIRFEDLSGPRTRIKYETEGILLRHLISDPLLQEVEAICFDEFHERHLHADIMLARAMQLQRTVRPDLLLMVMSATLDTNPLQTYLSNCAILSSEGRTYPVTVEYLTRPQTARAEPLPQLAAREMDRLIREERPGDALIFMPGAYEIHGTIRALQDYPSCREALILPLHGELPAREQDAAVANYNQRKIIVSTNVAETSLTIEGVRIVIDSGLARIPRFDPHRAINTLFIERISRASTDQRAGRAGRTAPGHCLRLWTEQEQKDRPLHEVPEIKRLDLAEALLAILAAGIEDLDTFPWFDPPESKALTEALRLLMDLGAVSGNDRRITPLGHRMASFPLHPRYARMLLAAEEYGCVRQAALIAALTQGRPILTRQTGTDNRKRRSEILGDDAASDFFLLMRAWRFAVSARFDLNKCRRIGVHAEAARTIQPVFDSFLKLAQRQGLAISNDPADDNAVCKSVLAGFADRVARRRDAGTLVCDIVHGRSGQLVRESTVQDATLFVASEIDEIQSGAQASVLIRLATRIEASWLSELFPEAVRETFVDLYDPRIQRVVREARITYHDLILSSRRTEGPSKENAARLLAGEVLRGRIQLNKWNDQVEQWILRVRLLAHWCPELAFPALSAEDRELVIQQICLGSLSAREVRDKTVWSGVRALLSKHHRHLLDRYAPEHLDLGAARPFRLVYMEHAAPSFKARIQELFGIRRIPSIAMGRVTPVIHILAPNQRPVQVTQDLDGFWRDHYIDIRQTLKRRYPRHAWPEDPFST